MDTPKPTPSPRDRALKYARNFAAIIALITIAGAIYSAGNISPLTLGAAAIGALINFVVFGIVAFFVLWGIFSLSK